jgi:hypothetical protein
MKLHLLIPATALFLSACMTPTSDVTNAGVIKGVPQAAPSIYTNDTANLGVFKSRIAEAKRVSSAFFGRPSANPAYVFCDTDACDGQFTLRTAKGAGALAKTVGDQLIVIGTGGRAQVIITHEQIHADIHSRFSLIDVLRGRLPAWFDEGLAGYVAKDTRIRKYSNLNDAKFVMSAKTAGQFGGLLSDATWQQTYGAATSLVVDMDRRLGRQGLLAFIDRVAAGADFNAELGRVMGPSWPQ